MQNTEKHSSRIYIELKIALDSEIYTPIKIMILEKLHSKAKSLFLTFTFLLSPQ